MSKQVDNSNPERKIFLRNKFISPHDYILDLFCGSGVIYNNCYKNNKYLGIDKLKIHSPEICLLYDNKKFIKNNDILDFDVFDLDDYGCPYILLLMILKKLSPIKKEYKFFLTDGSLLHYNLSGKFDGIIQKSENLTFKNKIKYAGRFSLDVFSTLMKKLSKKLSFSLTNIYFIYNSKKSVIYIYFSISPEPKGGQDKG